jgi:hypothetical protein
VRPNTSLNHRTRYGGPPWPGLGTRYILPARAKPSRRSGPVSSNVRPRNPHSAVLPLSFPQHFPPTTRWKKFFIGVRWLGPDLSFFKELKATQAARHPDQMNTWSDARQREIAEIFGEVLSRRQGWKSQVFLPQDSAAVVFHGPRFDFLDEMAVDEAIEGVEAKYCIKISKEFWAGKEESKFGDVIAAMAKLSEA